MVTVTKGQTGTAEAEVEGKRLGRTYIWSRKVQALPNVGFPLVRLSRLRFHYNFCREDVLVGNRNSFSHLDLTQHAL